MKIKVLSSYHEWTSSHFTWGEGYEEKCHVESAVMCLIPKDSHLTVKEASIIMNFCNDHHNQGEYNWTYDDKLSKCLAKELGEGWEGDNFIECCKDGQKEAEKVWKDINDEYHSFFSSSGLSLGRLPYQ